jgi:hypothetical protein
MSTYTEATESLSHKELFIKQVLSAWELQNKRVNNLLVKLSDEELLAEVAPGRNRGIYLLGHLTAISDSMLPLLGLGDKLYPDLTTLFVATPDKSNLDYPSLDLLKSYWNNVNTRLTEQFATLQPEDWFTKHTSVSDEDFAKDPLRNKLGILLSRTTHQSYHLGQLTFLG